MIGEIERPYCRLEYESIDEETASYYNFPWDAVVIVGLYADIKDKGYGTAILNEFLQENYKTPIVLHAYPFEEDDWLNEYKFEVIRQRLIKWYTRFGFVHIDSGWMIRHPTDNFIPCIKTFK